MSAGTAAAAAPALAALDGLDIETMLAPGFAHAQASGCVPHGAFVGWTWAFYARALIAVGDRASAAALADRIAAIPLPPGPAAAALGRVHAREVARIRAAMAGGDAA